MHLTRERMAEILERNARAFDLHREQLQAMQSYHDTRMRAVAKLVDVIEAHDRVLYRKFWGRLRWLVVGR